MTDKYRTGEKRTLIPEERLDRPQKLSLEGTIARPGAEYIEAAWQKTAREDLRTIHEAVDRLGPDRKGRLLPQRRDVATDVPVGLRARVTDALGPLAYVTLSYSTKRHHVCRVGLREGTKVRDVTVLVDEHRVLRIDTVERAVDALSARPPTAPVRITATMFDAAGPDKGRGLEHEWVELTNVSDRPVDLTGWALSDRAGHKYAFPAGFTLDPRGSVRVRTGAGADSDTNLHWGRRAAVWNNDGDTAYVHDAAGRLVAERTWP